MKRQGTRDLERSMICIISPQMKRNVVGNDMKDIRQSSRENSLFAHSDVAVRYIT